MHPAPHLPGVNADAISEPRLPAAIGVERLPQRGVQAGTFHEGTNCTPTARALSSAPYTSWMKRVPELIAELLPRLMDEKGLSRAQLSHATVRPGFKGIGEGTLKTLAKYPGRVPDAEIIEAVAQALEVSPDAFYEYPIALARRAARLSRGAQRAAAGGLASEEPVRLTSPEVDQQPDQAQPSHASKPRRAAGQRRNGSDPTRRSA